MTLDDVIEILAPCGLNCKKCVAYTKGDIQRISLDLQKFLGNFDTYAERYSKSTLHTKIINHSNGCFIILPKLNVMGVETGIVFTRIVAWQLVTKLHQVSMHFVLSVTSSPVINPGSIQT